MNSELKKIIGLFFALISLLGYTIMYAILLINNDVPNDQYIMYATGLASLVGGVVASSFGQTLPKNSKITLSKALLKYEPKYGEYLAIGYVIVYFGMGIWAIIHHSMNGDKSHELIQNLAYVSFTLFLAIAASAMTFVSSED